MNIQGVLEIAGSIIVSFGGSAAILVACTKWCSELLAKKMFENIKKQNEQEMEMFRTEVLKQRKENDALVDKTLFITKSQYEMEVKIYKEIWGNLYKCVASIKELFDFERELPEENRIYYEELNDRVKEVQDDFLNFSSLIDENAPFYVAEYYNKFILLKDEFSNVLELSIRLRNEAPNFSEELKNSSNQILCQILVLKEEILEDVRNYLQGLKIK